MKPAAFDYHLPTTVAEAVEMLDRLDDAKVLAGGQSLVPLMNFRLAAPANLIDISRLEELSAITVSDDAVTVGASVTHTQLFEHAEAAAAIPLLYEAEALIAHEVIRNRGTVCGSLAHADPSGELTAVLGLLDGSVDVASVRGGRTIPATDLFVGPLMSSLEEDELIVSARFGRPPAGTVTAIREVARRHGDYAVCGAAVRAALAADGTLSSLRAGFISVGPTPVLCDLTPVVAGRPLAEVDQGTLYDAVASQLDPSSDIHGTADYRRHLAGVLVTDALSAALTDDRSSAHA